MASHDNKNSMIKEALQEYIEVAEYCINFDKENDQRWDGIGCYGYPSGLLLLSIVDAIGTEIMGGGDDIKKHFEILNHPDYYNLGLDEKILEALRKGYRNRLSHNAYIGENVILGIGSEQGPIIEQNGNTYKLNLKPFYLQSRIAIKNFLQSN